MAKIFTKLNIGDVAYSSGGKCFKKLSTILPQLSAPTISIDGNTLRITDTSGHAEGYFVYANGALSFAVADRVDAIDLDGYITESGTYSITVKAYADGYEESEQSNVVEYVVSDVVTDLTGKTYYVKSGWVAEKGYGKFNINGFHIVDGVQSKTFEQFNLGYGSFYPYNGAYANVFSTVRNGSNYSQWDNSYSFTLTITGGNDVKSTKLIEWLDKYGELQ